MKIDVSTPDGHTFTALGHAVRFLKKIGSPEAYISEVQRAVLKANSAVEARMIIEQRTGGAISFVNTRS